MGKEIDRVRAKSAIETVKESPLIAAVALAPIVVILGVVWWLVGPGLAIALLVALGVVVVVGGKFVR
ncbi:hypothetical protein [Antrihabitans sp. YC2-6]|uniref:hypothetical protein n=1 Tax=Antrihabitans sp. YC2-6 TaxID=2799498 RepID=UPI0018F73BD0|nr:hypothetical protein [Antrihabitans sp. YC2-6]MBJ8347961.1 hypothetical protein [Antrihabitans sp. YC2-6]